MKALVLNSLTTENVIAQLPLAQFSAAPVVGRDGSASAAEWLTAAQTAMPDPDVIISANVATADVAGALAIIAAYPGVPLIFGGNSTANDLWSGAGLGTSRAVAGYRYHSSRTPWTTTAATPNSLATALAVGAVASCIATMPTLWNDQAWVAWMGIAPTTAAGVTDLTPLMLYTPGLTGTPAGVNAAMLGRKLIMVGALTRSAMANLTAAFNYAVQLAAGVPVDNFTVTSGGTTVPTPVKLRWVDAEAQLVAWGNSPTGAVSLPVVVGGTVAAPFGYVHVSATASGVVSSVLTRPAVV